MLCQRDKVLLINFATWRSNYHKEELEALKEATARMFSKKSKGTEKENVSAREFLQTNLTVTVLSERFKKSQNAEAVPSFLRAGLSKN